MIVKETQELARHSTADTTMNVYGRANDERLTDAVKRVGRVLLQPEGVPEEYQTRSTKTKPAQPI